MKKSAMIPTTELLDKAKGKLHKEVNAVLVITVNENDARSFCAGIDEMGMSPTTVALVAVMDGLLNGKLRIAKAIFDHMTENGALEVETKCEEVHKRGSAEDAKAGAHDFPKDFLHDLIDTIFSGVACGEGDENAPDT